MSKKISKILIVALLISCLTGCSSKEDTQKVQDLEFTVVEEGEIPEELSKLIEGKKAQEFRLTYTNDAYLYIVVGYGEQSTGGYSIQVKELYLTANSIYIDTELLGPSKDETVSQVASYPYVVVKLEYREEPVVFR